MTRGVGPSPASGHRVLLWRGRATGFLLLGLIGCLLGITDPSWAAAVATGSLEFQIGAADGQFGQSGAEEGPIVGPVSLAASGNGLAVLDAVNQRLVQIDADGAWKKSLRLPPGSFKDLARGADGRIWLYDEASATAFVVAKGGVTKAFSLADGRLRPRQADALVCAGQRLVVLDYASRGLFWISREGEIEETASVPVTLALCEAPDGRVAFLAPDEEDAYRRLVILGPGGRREEHSLNGPGFLGARLLALLPDGRSVVAGLDSDEPLRRVLFVQGREGDRTVIHALDTPLKLAQRYGVVTPDGLWFNASPIEGQVVFRFFALPDR